MKRTELLAYLVGAGVCGTLVIVPYTGRPILTAIFPQLRPLSEVPFFLLPLAWGIWNWIRVRTRPGLGIGAWGAVLGLVIAALANALLAAGGLWFAAASLLLVTLPAGYYLLWLLLVGPLNEALDLEPLRRPERS